jgi:predicted Fe-Mo cluster-binding NifX family protein
MKIVISSVDETKKSEIDPHFGRCPFFTIAEVENGELLSMTTQKNEAAEQGHGAGTTAADFVANLGAKVVISGNFGPKAEGVLTELKIEMVKDEGTVEDVVKRYLAK